VCQAGRVLICFAPHWLHLSRCPTSGTNVSGNASTLTSALCPQASFAYWPASLAKRPMSAHGGSNSWNLSPKWLIHRRKASGGLGEGRRSLNCSESLRVNLKRLFVEPF
jgi:hypothetical protein